MRSTKVAIVNVGEWKDGKYKPFTPVRVITMKEISTGKSLNLSLNKKNEKRVNDWLPVIKVGNELEVTVLPNFNDKKKKDSEYIDFGGKFTFLKEADQPKDLGKPVENPEDAFKLSLGLQLNKMEANAKENLSIVQQIKLDFDL